MSALEDAEASVKYWQKKFAEQQETAKAEHISYMNLKGQFDVQSVRLQEVERDCRKLSDERDKFRALWEGRERSNPEQELIDARNAEVARKYRAEGYEKCKADFIKRVFG